MQKENSSFCHIINDTIITLKYRYVCTQINNGAETIESQYMPRLRKERNKNLFTLSSVHSTLVLFTVHVINHNHNHKFIGSKQTSSK